MHDTDSGESIDNAKTVVEPPTDEQNASDIAAAATAAPASAPVDELASDIVKSIAEEIVEQATAAAAPSSSVVDQIVESKSDVPTLMQVLTPENVVLPAQQTASDATAVGDQ